MKRKFVEGAKVRKYQLQLSFISFLLGSSLTGLAVCAEEVTPLKGAIVGVQVSESAAGMSMGAGVVYWHDYVGADFGMDVRKADVKLGSSKFLDLSSYNFTFGLRGGFQVKAFKPYARVALSYALLDNEVSNIQTRGFHFNPSLGIEFIAMPHLVFGLEFMRANFVMSGDVTQNNRKLDLSGNEFAFLSGFSLGYLF